MGIETRINIILQRFPYVKKIVKRLYQSVFVLFSRRKENFGNLVQLTPNDGKEYFFGYYDKSPWDISDRYVLCLQAKCTWKDVAPKEPANIVIIDTKNNNTISILGKTHAWNVQQGCMLQWLGPDFQSKILFNDFRDNHYCSVILNIRTMQETVIPNPVYSVAANGSFALTLDFSRLHRLRKGYGYSNLPDKTAGIIIPDSPCIWKVDLLSGKTIPLLDYNDFYRFETRKEMTSAEHKVNHIMISPSGSRFMVLHRWMHGHRKYSRLVTCNIDGTGMYNLLDDDMVSHCNWKNDNEIIAFANKKNSGVGYYLLTDKAHDFKRLWPELERDGHPSYSPDRSLVVTDSYPDRTRMSSIYCMAEDANPRVIAKVFSPFRYDNDVRCDLHPRWSHAGEKICFDGISETHRGLYAIDIMKRKESIKDNNILIISLSPFSSFDNMGSTLARLFNGINKDKINQFYIGNSYPDLEMCKSVFRISDIDLITKRWKKEKGTVIRNIAGQNNIKSISSVYGTFKKTGFSFSYIFIILRNMIWGNSWKSKNLIKWLDENDSDVIFFTLNRYIFTYKILKEIRHHKKAMTVLYIADDYYIYNRGSGWLSRIYLMFLRHQISSVMNNTACFISISEQMTKEYSQIFGIEGYTLMTPFSNYAEPTDLRYIKEECTAVYLGNLEFGRYKAILEVGSCLHDIEIQTGVKIRFKVYSGTKDKKILRALNSSSYIEFMGEVSNNKVLQIIKSSDFTFHVESFELKEIKKIKLSISTKIPDLLANANTLIGYGPMEIASIQHLMKISQDIVATTKDELIKKISILIKEHEKRCRIQKLMRKHAIENHSDSSLVRIEI